MQAAIEELAECSAVNFQLLENAPNLGDETAVMKYEHINQLGVTNEDYRIYVRVGAESFTIALNTTEALDTEAMNDLAELQAECLLGEEPCVDTVRVLAGLR